MMHISVRQSGVPDSYYMRVPIDVWVKGSPHRLGLVSVKGSTTATADVPLGFRPDKVTLDENHSILAIER